MKVEKTNFVCEDMRKIESYTRLSECVEMIKEYDPQPKNTNGSIRWFLYRWDDGKTGVRRLNRCRKCGALYLVQAYHLNKFSPYKDIQFEDWYWVESEEEAENANKIYTGLQWEVTHVPAMRCRNDEVKR